MRKTAEGEKNQVLNLKDCLKHHQQNYPGIVQDVYSNKNPESKMRSELGRLTIEELVQPFTI